MEGWKLETNEYDCLNLKTLAEVDVLVVGGGPAGVAAATISGENNLKTLLIEKYGFCGGAAVAGLSATICGLYETVEDNSGKNPPNQIVYGFADRFVQEMKKNNGLTEPQIYGNTYVLAHESIIWKKTADSMLQKANVEILYHTTVVGVIKDKNKVTGVIVYSGKGLGIIKAKRTIDCSGDGVVAAMAGNSFHCGLNGNVQNPTIIFKISNIDQDEFWKQYGEDTICNDDFSVKLKEAENNEKLELPRKKIWVFKTVNENEIYINATRISHISKELNMINPEDFTYAEIKAREQMFDYFNFFKKHIAGCEKSYIGEVGCEVGVRQTRSIKGKYMLKNSDVEKCRKFEDGIVRSSWPIELHKGEVPKLVWLIKNFYEVPFRCLQPESLENILVAGRCISAEHEALASARVTAQCFEYGHAAALGAVHSLINDYPTSKIDGKIIRKLIKL